MGRSYHLSKQIVQCPVDRILREIEGLPEVKRVALCADMTELEIETDNQEYTAVMARAVNLFSRLGNGCELSFSHFVL